MKNNIYLFVISLLVSFSANAEEIQVPAGTAVVVALAETISSATHKTGDSVQMIVVGNVEVNGKIVIKDGTAVVGNILKSEESGFAGQSGSLQIGASSTTSVDGKTVGLNGQKSFEGEDEIVGTVVVSALICPVALVNEGDDAEAGTNTQFRAVVVAPVRVNV